MSYIPKNEHLDISNKEFDQAVLDNGYMYNQVSSTQSQEIPSASSSQNEVEDMPFDSEIIPQDEDAMSVTPQDESDTASVSSQDEPVSEHVDYQLLAQRKNIVMSRIANKTYINTNDLKLGAYALIMLLSTY